MPSLISLSGDLQDLDLAKVKVEEAKQELVSATLCGGSNFQPRSQASAQILSPKVWGEPGNEAIKPLYL